MSEMVSYGRARQWTVLAALWLATLVVGLDTMVLSVALATLSRDLGATNADLQWVTDAYTLSLAALLLPVGMIADRIGRRRVLLTGLAVFGAASAACAEVQTPGQLIAARAVLGAGAAVLLSVPLSMLPTVFGPQGRGRAMSILVSGMMLGLPLGPVLGGYLLEHYWWGSVFLINVPVVVLALAVVAVAITDSRATHARRPDLPGVALSTLGLVALVYGIIEGPNRGWTDPQVLGGMAGGALLLVAFGLWQAHTANPLVPLSRFADRRLNTGVAAMTVASFALFGVVFVVPQYLQVVLGHGPLAAGVRLLPMIGGLLASAPLSDRIARRYGTRLPVAAGLLVVAVGLAVHSRISAGSGYPLTATGLAVEGFGMGLALPPAMDTALSAFGEAESGTGSAVIQSIRQVGATLSVAVLGSVLNAVYRDRINAHLSGLPQGPAHAARGSVGAAVAVAERLGPAGRALRAAAESAFTQGVSALLLVCAATATAGAIGAALLLPSHRPEKEATPPGDRDTAPQPVPSATAPTHNGRHERS